MKPKPSALILKERSLHTKTFYQRKLPMMASPSINQVLLARFMTHTSPQNQSSFLERLPIEIRLQIYKLVLDQITVHDERSQNGAWRIEGPQILAVCKKVFCEALEYATRVSYILDWTNEPSNTLSTFFNTFPSKIRHRLEKITLLSSRSQFRKWSSELNVGGFSVLRMIELLNEYNEVAATNDRDTLVLFDHVANLIRCVDGPSAFGSDDSFTSKALATYCSPAFVGFLQTSNVVVRTKADLRFKVWERFQSEAPFWVGWQAISVTEYWDCTIEWRKDSVSLIDCPDFRDWRWYSPWAEKPTYYRESDFIPDAADHTEDVRYVLCIDHALPRHWGNDWGLTEFVPGSWE